MDFSELTLMSGYKRFADSASLVDVYEVMDLDIILGGHPNWDEIRQLPPLFIHDCPPFLDDSTIDPEMLESDEIDLQRLRFSNQIKLSDDRKNRCYRLVLFSTEDPTRPIAYGSMDINLLSRWDIDGQTNRPDEIGLKLEFLHTFVDQEYRFLGLAGLLGFVMGNLFWHQIQHVLQQLEQIDSGNMLRPIIIGHEIKAGGKFIVNSVEREMRMMSNLYEKQERDFRLENSLVSFPGFPPEGMKRAANGN